MVGLLQKQEILPVSIAAPSFVCVDIVTRSTIYLNDLYAHVLKRIIGGKSVGHQNLAKGNNVQVMEPLAS